MTVRKILEKYMRLQKQNYEMVLITEVIKDLRLITFEYDIRKIERQNKRNKNET